MRLIHTADWHLGQRFKDNLNRKEEHEHFLNWLLNTIELQKTDVLVIAGDIFDSPNPPSYAQQQYYSFLARLYAQGICKDVVITGGNHDSPERLNAPKELLKVLNVHVVGAIAEDGLPFFVSLPSASQKPSIVIVAVPFLRDQDMLKSQDRETMSGRELRLREGIVAHYNKAMEAVSHFKEMGVPIIATGHLFAQGCEASSDSERVIHIGALGQVNAMDFPIGFDYIALGHLHRPQVVAGKDHIRYCGSPIPLSFSERDYKHQVVLLELNKEGKLDITSEQIPVLRQLKRIEGTWQAITERLKMLTLAAGQLTTWAELWIQSDESPVLVAERVRKIAEEINQVVRIVDFRQTKTTDRISTEPVDEYSEALEDLLPTAVFNRLLDANNVKAGREILMETFMELLSQQDKIKSAQ